MGAPSRIVSRAMDIGQTIVVRDLRSVAVEAMEGTDAVIRRAGDLVHKKDLTVIKVKQTQNRTLRFDIPVVGLATLEHMIDSGATALVIDAQRTIVWTEKDWLRRQTAMTWPSLPCLPLKAEAALGRV